MRRAIVLAAAMFLAMTGMAAAQAVVDPFAPTLAPNAPGKPAAKGERTFEAAHRGNLRRKVSGLSKPLLST